MGWVKMSDERADHPKLLMAGLAARGLDEAAICWSSSHLTDGYLPANAVAMLAAGHGERAWRKLADRLVAVGRWERVGDDYQIRNYLEWQRSKTDVEKERNATRQRVKRHRNGVTTPVTSGVSPPITDAVTPPASNGSVTATKKQKQNAEAEQQQALPETHDPPAKPGGGEGSAAAAAALIRDALKILAYRHQPANGQVRNPAGWLKTVTGRLALEHHDRLAELVNTGQVTTTSTAEQLADMLEPPAARWAPCDDPACHNGNLLDETGELIGRCPNHTKAAV